VRHHFAEAATPEGNQRQQNKQIHDPTRLIIVTPVPPQTPKAQFHQEQGDAAADAPANAVSRFIFPRQLRVIAAQPPGRQGGKRQYDKVREEKEHDARGLEMAA
jgi:hypothetical protein